MIAMAYYDDRLMRAMAAKGKLTATQIGEIVGCYSADALTRLRARRNMRVTIVGTFSPNGRGARRKLYVIEKVPPANVVKGAYCCGFCERQRQEGSL